MTGPRPLGPAAIGLAVLANLLGGATYWATKNALEGVPPTTLSLLRTLVALGLLVPLAPRGSIVALWRDGARARLQVLAMGVLGYALPLTLGNFGVEQSTATNGALLIGMEPAATVVLAAILLGESVTRPRIVALVLGLLGSAVIVANGIPLLTDLSTTHLSGDLLLFAHSAAWATWTVAAKPLVDRHAALAVTSAALALSVPLLLPVAAMEWSDVDRSRFVEALPWALALGGLVSALGTFLWNAALQRMDASQIAGFIFIQPVVGSALGIVLLGERPTVWAFFGGGLVFLGVFFLVTEGRYSGATGSSTT